MFSITIDLKMNAQLIKKVTENNLKYHIQEEVNQKKKDLENYIVNLIDDKIVTKIYFGRDSYIDYIQKSIFYKNKKINLTKIEYELFKLLVENYNKMISYNEIAQLSWRKEKVTKFSIRNQINRLRTKMDKDLIKNKPNYGYTLVVDTYEFEHLNT